LFHGREGLFSKFYAPRYCVNIRYHYVLMVEHENFDGQQMTGGQVAVGRGPDLNSLLLFPKSSQICSPLGSVTK